MSTLSASEKKKQDITGCITMKVRTSQLLVVHESGLTVKSGLFQTEIICRVGIVLASPQTT